MRDINPQERRRMMLSELQKNGVLRVSELSAKYGVSEVTVRADLAELEGRGLLSRTHGGAVSEFRSYFNMSLSQRITANGVEKQKIASKIAELFSDNDTVFINAGTTPLYILRAIESRNVTIVTNSIALALESGQKQNIKTLLLGGEINAEYQFTFGSDTLQRLRRYRFDKAVLSVDGVAAEGGYTTWYFQEADLCREVFSAANKVIIAADHTKIGRTAFASISDAADADIIVTNTNACDEECARLAALGIEIIRA